MDNCPRDPNFKTKVNSDNEILRLMKTMEGKRGFSDTSIQTTHMLKRCVLVPEKEINEGHNKTVFKRGVMGFEDFNYE